MKKSFALPLLLALSLIMAACAPAAAPAPAPTAVPPTAMPEPTAAPEPMAKDIVDTAIAAGNFTTLAAALEAAGLVEALKGEGPFTVFAPTDEAFAKLPAGTLDALLKDPAALGDILKYHVVAGKVMAADVLKHDSVTTLLGKDAPIRLNGNSASIAGATIIQTDIETSNGVIHVIDAVMLPPQ